MSRCEICPRVCGVDRGAGELGFCGVGGEIRVARAALHPFEEPCISGTRGSGTVFFSGCSLRCAFCQNRAISREEIGRAVTPYELFEIFFDLERQGAHNINLVTPTHFTDGIAEALRIAKARLSIPVIWNSSGYERVETLRSLEGLVDVYMPDVKYASAALAERYSAAADYPKVVEAALREMYRQVGRVQMDEDGLLKRGMLVRHLVLPAGRQDSIEVLHRLAAQLPVGEIFLSLMSQYTPEFAKDSPHKELRRRVTTFEYESVLKHAEALGFEGYMQSRASATASYTPDF